MKAPGGKGNICPMSDSKDATWCKEQNAKKKRSLRKSLRVRKINMLTFETCKCTCTYNQVSNSHWLYYWEY